MRRRVITILHTVGLLLLTHGIAAASDSVTSDDNDFREDVIKCEVAVAHVEACCPDVKAPPAACVYHYKSTSEDCGCDDGYHYTTESTWPVIDIATSDAIRAKSCDELAANYGCTKLADQIGQKNSSFEDVGSCGQTF